MEQDFPTSALILPDISVFWPGLATPRWTVGGISAIQRWFGTQDQLILAGSPDFTMDELIADETGFNHAWTHWTYQQSRCGLMPRVAIIHNGAGSNVYRTFGPQFIGDGQQIRLRVADRQDFEACAGKPKKVSGLWKSLLRGHFNVDRWDINSMLMGNLNQTVTAEKFSQVVVLDEIQGRLTPTIVTIPAAA